MAFSLPLLLMVKAAALIASCISVTIAADPNVGLQQPSGQPAAQQPQKNYKDRAEYDLYSKITQTQDPKARLDLLNQWQRNIRRAILPTTV